jgi:hypothetical protein
MRKIHIHYFEDGFTGVLVSSEKISTITIAQVHLLQNSPMKIIVPVRKVSVFSVKYPTVNITTFCDSEEECYGIHEALS